MRGRQIFTRANIYVSDLGDLAVPMRPASGSRGLRAPHLAARGWTDTKVPGVASVLSSRAHTEKFWITALLELYLKDA